MQIRLGTARAMGYHGGSPQGLLDADTNMTYAVKYLAGAYRAAGCDPRSRGRHIISAATTAYASVGAAMQVAEAASAGSSGSPKRTFKLAQAQAESR